MSGWAGPRYDRGETWPPFEAPWDTAVGEPQHLPQWPPPGSRRVSGTMRWPSDSLFRPHHSRRWGFVGYVTDAEYPLGSWKYREYYWIDLFESQPFELVGATPRSAYGSQVRMVLRYHDVLPGLGLPGVRSEISVSAGGQADRLFVQEFTNSNYGFAGPLGPEPAEFPVGQAPQAGVPWAHSWAWYKPMAECYPIDTLTLGAMMKAGKSFVLITSDGSSPSTHGGVFMPLGSPLKDYGDWYKPLSATDGVIVPAGVSNIRGSACCRAGNSANSHSIEVVNRTTPWGVRPYHRTKPDFSTEGIISVPVPILPVVAGDVISVEVSKSNASLNADSEFNFLFVEAVLDEVLPIARQISGYGDPLPGIGEIAYVGEIPPTSDGFELTSVVASLLSAKSAFDPITCQVSAIRKATRSVEDFLSNVLTIDTDHWASDTSSSPAVINPATSTVFAGDLVIVTILDPGANALGLSISLEFTEP